MRLIDYDWCPLCNREWEIKSGRTNCPRCYATLIRMTKDLDISW